MNEQEIQKLAEEFARLKTVSQAGAGEEIRRKTLLLTQFVWFLSDRYCIVEKSKVKEINSQVTDTYLIGSHISFPEGWKYILESFFGKGIIPKLYNDK